MPRIPTSRLQLRIANVVFIGLFIVAVGLLQWVSSRYHLRADWTHNNSNSLSDASIAATERLSGPVRITAYASKNSGLRVMIENFVKRYQQHKFDIELEFVDPDSEPERVRAANVQYDGELIISHGEARESLAPTELTEEAFTNALTRLGRRGERWVVFLAGHGERSPDTARNFDVSLWAEQMQKRGFQTRSLTLAEAKQIPQNTSVLVIAGPRTQLLAGEVKEIEAYLARGGNMLWLLDPGSLRGLEPIAEQLGIEVHPGTIVDPAAQALTGNPTAILVARYNSHPVVRNSQHVTVFPEAAALNVQPPKGWGSQVLLDTSERAWSETGSLIGHLQYDKGKDIGGPLILGATLTRPVEGREQRVAIVGDGDFLSNSIIGNGGNLELGLSLANWLSHDDTYVNIPVQTARDNYLERSATSVSVLTLVFLILLPLGLIGSGVTLWWRRRKL
jgi:ABC-type uncharacterized transport system involved in gliding motility auxiliary subunit